MKELLAGIDIDLSGAVFHGIDIEGGDLSDATLQGADFSNASLYGTYLYRANCTGCDFTGAILKGVVLDEANFDHAIFTDAQLLKNNMGVLCSLKGADLKHALLDNADLSGCSYSLETVFPSGFDPISRGMIRRE